MDFPTEPDPFKLVPHARTTRQFLLGLARSTVYVTQLATPTPESCRFYLGYMLLHLVRAHGGKGEAIDLVDASGVDYARRLGFPGYFGVVRRALRGDRLFLLGAHGPVCAWLSTLGVGSPAVFSVIYGLDNPKRSGLFAAFSRTVRFSGLHRSLIVSASSQRVLDEAIRRCNLSPEQTYLLRSGVDSKFFHPLPPDSGHLSFSVRTGSGQIQQLSPKRYVCLSGDQLRIDEVVFESLRDLPITIVRTSRQDITAPMRTLLSRVSDRKFDLKTLIDVSWIDLKRIYQNAAAVIVATDNSWQPAGWTTLTESLAVGTPTLVARGINSEEIALITGSTDERDLCVGVWDASDPASLRRLVDQCLSGCWPRRHLLKGRQIIVEELDIDILAERLFSSPQWQRFLEA